MSSGAHDDCAFIAEFNVPPRSVWITLFRYFTINMPRYATLAGVPFETFNTPQQSALAEVIGDGSARWLLSSLPSQGQVERRGDRRL